MQCVALEWSRPDFSSLLVAFSAWGDQDFFDSLPFTQPTEPGRESYFWRCQPKWKVFHPVYPSCERRTPALLPPWISTPPPGKFYGSLSNLQVVWHSCGATAEESQQKERGHSCLLVKQNSNSSAFLASLNQVERPHRVFLALQQRVDTISNHNPNLIRVCLVVDVAQWIRMIRTKVEANWNTFSPAKSLTKYITVPFRSKHFTKGRFQCVDLFVWVYISNQYNNSNVCMIKMPVYQRWLSCLFSSGRRSRREWVYRVEMQASREKRGLAQLLFPPFLLMDSQPENRKRIRDGGKQGLRCDAPLAEQNGWKKAWNLPLSHSRETMQL